MKIYYRISGSQKHKPGQFSDWKRCLENFIKVFDNNLITLICDNVTDDIRDYCRKLQYTRFMTSLGNSGSFLYALDLALQNDYDDEIAYFVEDDYLHIKDSQDVLTEGFTTGADYVTLYDHADKYMEYYSRNSWGGEPTKVLLTKSTHWKQVSSTCMTFAAKVKTLREDYDLIRARLRNPVPEDWQMWMDLGRKGRRLINPIPGYATHCIKEYKSPIVDWSAI